MQRGTLEGSSRIHDELARTTFQISLLIGRTETFQAHRDRLKLENKFKVNI